jgi:hypothetical protein
MKYKLSKRAKMIRKAMTVGSFIKTEPTLENINDKLQKV